jgi:hypothetical protein
MPFPMVPAPITTICFMKPPNGGEAYHPPVGQDESARL